MRISPTPAPIVALSLAIALAACTAQPAASGPPPLSPTGIGKLKIGATSAALKDRFRAKLRYDSDPANPDGCALYGVPDYPGLDLMVVDGKLARIDVTKGKAGYATEAGARVGMRTAEIRKIYGPMLKVEPHKYVETGQYLMVQTGNGRHGIVFETDRSIVTTLRVGRWDEVQWVEGCS